MGGVEGGLRVIYRKAVKSHSVRVSGMLHGEDAHVSFCMDSFSVVHAYVFILYKRVLPFCMHMFSFCGIYAMLFARLENWCRPPARLEL